jgi:hypothetical protein
LYKVGSIDDPLTLQNENKVSYTNTPNGNVAKTVLPDGTNGINDLRL